MEETLAAPLLIGPVSTWSTRILVTGCSPGAEVKLHRVGNKTDLIGSAMANDSECEVELTSAVAAGERIVAIQELDGQSAATPEAQALEITPSLKADETLPNPWLLTTLYVWGEAMWITGCFPGTRIEIWQDSQRLGNAEAKAHWMTEGFSIGARMRLDHPLVYSQVEIRTVSPNGDLLNSMTVAPINYADQLPEYAAQGVLPPPIITQPVSACDRAVGIGGIVDGARVVLTVNIDKTYEAIYDRDFLWFSLPAQLNAGDTVQATQFLPVVRQPSYSSVEIAAIALKPPPPLLLPPCDGQTTVTVSNLIRGGSVVIESGEQKVSQLVPADRQTIEIGLRDPLSIADGQVRCTQYRCEIASDPVSAAIAAERDQLPPPSMGMPLRECASAVYAVFETGHKVRIRSLERGLLTGSVSVPSNSSYFNFRMTVSGLRKGELIVAEGQQCSGGWIRSEQYEVGPELESDFMRALQFNLRFYDQAYGRESELTVGTETVVMMPVPCGMPFELFRLRGDNLLKFGSGYGQPSDNASGNLPNNLLVGDRLILRLFPCAGPPLYGGFELLTGSEIKAVLTPTSPTILRPADSQREIPAGSPITVEAIDHGWLTARRVDGYGLRVMTAEQFANGAGDQAPGFTAGKTKTASWSVLLQEPATKYIIMVQGFNAAGSGQRSVHTVYTKGYVDTEPNPNPNPAPSYGGMSVSTWQRYEGSGSNNATISADLKFAGYGLPAQVPISVEIEYRGLDVNDSYSPEGFLSDNAGSFSGDRSMSGILSTITELKFKLKYQTANGSFVATASATVGLGATVSFVKE